MSDFDEEAERERLREQFEHDQKKREATEHMSELLLQGATMTDAHCETCGDPIFRYDGQEFCPTCQGAGGENASEERGSAEDVDDANASAPETSGSQPTTEERPADAPAESSPSAPAGTSKTPSAEAATDETTGQQPAQTDETGGEQRVDVPALDPGQQQPKARETGDLQDARDSLVATLSSFARQAEATEDPRRASDALEAAREAAETLAALDRLR